MAEIINFRQARKNLKRTEKGKKAQENRVRSGLSKIEKNKRMDDQDRQSRDLDGKLLDGASGNGDEAS
ncbi:MAG: DUF4169 family protein [Rhodospirillales bacterium]|nr:DUF4169 family protein [Rhodospirillales bacterium]